MINTDYQMVDLRPHEEFGPFEGSMFIGGAVELVYIYFYIFSAHAYWMALYVIIFKNENDERYFFNKKGHPNIV